MRFIQAGALALLLVTAAHPAHAQNDNAWTSFWNLFREADLQVKVTDSDGSALKNVSVLVGQRLGDPFSGNQALTNSEGVASFTHESLRTRTPFTVTASRPGFTTLTLLNQAPGVVEMRLDEQPDERDFAFFNGRVTGFPPGVGSGNLEMGIFLPAFRPESLMNFDPQHFISSYEVKIDVFGEREVPGNLVLPRQTKRYGLIPISLSKPDYIMPLPRGLNAHMGAMVGNVGISGAVDAIKKKDFLATINLTNFTHIGWTSRRVDVRGNETFDVHAGQEVAAQAVTAQLGGVPERLDAVAVTLFDVAGDGEDFIPLDVKALKSEHIRNGAGSVKLGVLKQRRSRDNFYVFAGLFDGTKLNDKNNPSRWIVGSLEPVDNRLASRHPKFLSPIRSGTVAANNREYRFNSAVNQRHGLTPDFVRLNIVSEKKNAATKGVTRNVLWTVVLPGNAEGVNLPDLGRAVLPAPDTAKKERFVWEVIAVKAQEGARAPGLGIQSKNLEHVSSLSQNF